MKGLTARQQEVLQFLEQFIAQNGYAPTVREIGERFAFSGKAAHDHLGALQKKGFITHLDNCSRSIRVLKNAEGESRESFITVPVLGEVAAGRPIMAEENIDEYIRVDCGLLKKKAGRQYFALKVRGNSMTGAGVMDGDTAIIEKCAVANDRDIVVAWHNDRVTLKRYFKEPTRVRLQPENDRYLPIYSKNVRIEGRLACVIRKY